MALSQQARVLVRDGADGTLICGFHAPGSWHDIVPVTDCLLASERSNVAREQVLAWCREQGLEAFDRRTHTGLLRNLVVREGRRTGQLQVRLVTGPGDIDGPSLAAAVECEGLSWTTTDALAETTLGGETIKLAGNRTLEEELCGLSFSIAPNAFFQTNTEMAEQLYGIAGDLADLKGWERVYDLYCGIGTVGLSLAARAGEVWGLEIVEQAVANAISNAKRNGIGNAKFFAGDVRLALRELVEQASRPDVCVIDPPRAGLSQKVVRRIIEAAPRRIVYISCNPTTLAPNAAQLVEAGYALKRVVPVDMFPQTPHIECVALLERGLTCRRLAGRSAVPWPTAYPLVESRRPWRPPARLIAILDARRGRADDDAAPSARAAQDERRGAASAPSP